MSTLTTPAAPTARAARPAYRVTGRHVLRSEWTKLWSLRSTWITLGLGLVFLVAFGLISAARYNSNISSGQPLDPDFAGATALSLSLFGTNFAQLALGVLGVLVTAGEYSTGMIRSTLTGVPRRLPVLWSKSAVFGIVALLVGVIGAFLAFVFGSAIVAGTPAAMTLSDTGVLRSLLGAGLYLGLVGVIGVALGALLRSVAGGISVLVGALMLIPGLISLLPKSWQGDLSPYLPSNAGQSMFALTHDATSLAPGTGLLVFLGWTVLLLAGAAYRLARSDA
ncbi:integral membrane protein [Amycolatopsis mediterranei S699]|uniref:Integral membrane protein n=2 Tax=Amycolatopsis mediterranei TaxID=33910 RepID=A0A0H3DC08_AMYMU|nr:ABC transporter permease [Amycolatopsis mediterranei]ADJ48221.1 integral membrane protein [Amycolatopsis mediterranei U32]AEK45128.1 integral membrane protein [Amycolatopsis mediterranei S699]AFO79932.1 integral membrane protein [Amycolatopsis mediterranei S699]AGT87060.1 integral membrane protein [Amycolatopsis mediterranei RB]KDO10707.1 membrane protein [Amycolatopsis mediterranei]